MTCLPKAIHVELSDEGSKVSMFEVDRQDFLSESRDVLDDKGVVGGGPADGAADVGVLCKGRSTSSISTSLLMKRGTCEFFPRCL